MSGDATDNAVCHDHEARIRVLEKSYDTLIQRIDRTDLAIHAIERAVSSLQDEMESHITVMQHHIDTAFARHETTEIKMHKDMLVSAMKTVVAITMMLMSGLGALSWWIFNHLVGAG